MGKLIWWDALCFNATAARLPTMVFLGMVKVCYVVVCGLGLYYIHMSVFSRTSNYAHKFLVDITLARVLYVYAQGCARNKRNAVDTDGAHHIVPFVAMKIKNTFTFDARPTSTHLTARQLPPVQLHHTRINLFDRARLRRSLNKNAHGACIYYIYVYDNSPFTICTNWRLSDENECGGRASEHLEYPARLVESAEWNVTGVCVRMIS